MIGPTEQPMPLIESHIWASFQVDRQGLPPELVARAAGGNYFRISVLAKG